LRNADELPSETVDNFYKHIGANVKRLRMEKGYSQLELSQALGFKSVGLVSQAEIYLNKQHFNLKHLLQIAYILDCEIIDLITVTCEND
jgi:transcriptional regulator with XRE-family HTH domain